MLEMLKIEIYINYNGTKVEMTPPMLPVCIHLEIHSYCTLGYCRLEAVHLSHFHACGCVLGFHQKGGAGEKGIFWMFVCVHNG